MIKGGLILLLGSRLWSWEKNIGANDEGNIDELRQNIHSWVNGNEYFFIISGRAKAPYNAGHNPSLKAGVIKYKSSRALAEYFANSD
jgi:hypothetical protein